jgi:cell fate regulator YaaT (PSP1 superfamily)
MARYVVRYGVTRALGVFSTRGSEPFARGMKVIVKSNRGMEVGEILCEATDNALAQMPPGSGGQLMREMTAADTVEHGHLQAKQKDAFATCQRRIAELGLPMEMVDVEHLFGGERIVVYYLSEDRVDFRELVKLLATDLQTRIEMRQIGVRDEAKLLADYGDCGKPVCCNTHLHQMPPVSMRMAKLQKATLDPTKISGRCGRLKCCLRYEYDTYEELLRELPPIGAEIVTNTGRGRVLGQEILAQQLLVQMDDNRRLLVPASDVLTVLRRPGGDGGRRRAEPETSGDDAAADED